MALPTRSVLLVRPGALGDAVLTLPALHALREAGVRRITVLGTPASWAFMRWNASAGALRVQDGGAQDWLGLYAPGAALSPAARALLAATDLAWICLGSGGACAAQAMLAEGVCEVRLIDPPKLGEPVNALAPGSAPADAQINASHAARRLLDPIIRWFQEKNGKNGSATDNSSTLRSGSAVLKREAVVLSPLKGRGRGGKISQNSPRFSKSASENRSAGVLAGCIAAVPAASFRTHSKPQPSNSSKNSGSSPVGEQRSVTLGPLSLADDPLLSVTPEEVAAALQRLRVDAPPAAGWLALHPGSGGQLKRWPAECFVRLAVSAARRLKLVPLLFFGPADEQAQKEMEAAWPRGVPAHRAENLPLREVLALLSIARIFVGNDSGLTHLAARCTPTLALFGPTDPRVWQPLGRQVTILRSPTRTMNGLALKEVLAALELLANGK